MNSMHRQFGKLMSKGPGEAAKISVLLNDYEDADKTLMKVSFTCPKYPGIPDLLTPIGRSLKHQKPGGMPGFLS